MKIAYVTVQDSTNIRSFSGTGYYVPKSLEMNGAEIQYIGKLKTQPYVKEKFKELFYQYLVRKKYWFNRDPIVLKNYAKQIKKELDPSKTDAIVSISSIPLTMLDVDIPIFVWGDAVFPDIIDFYPEFTNMAKETLRNAYKMEKIALDRCAHAVFSSDWAAQSAIRNYNLPPEKVSVITYGANIETNWTQKDVEQLIHSKSSQKLKLLFVGVQWERKGGDLAVEATKLLNERGVPAELHILGSQPKKNQALPDYIKQYGFVSKETKEGQKLIHDLISSAHFLILPTQADCTPIVYAEFNSYGIPCLTSDVGGIKTLIRDNVNGKTFSLKNDPKEYADYAAYLFNNFQEYKTLAMNSYQEYTSRLNWKNSGAKMMNLISNLINSKQDTYERSFNHAGA